MCDQYSFSAVTWSVPLPSGDPVQRLHGVSGSRSCGEDLPAVPWMFLSAAVRSTSFAALVYLCHLGKICLQSDSLLSCHRFLCKKLRFVFAGDTGSSRDWGPEEETGGGRDGVEAGAGGQRRPEGCGGADGGKRQSEGGQEGSDQWSRRRSCPEPALREEELQRWWVHALVCWFSYIEIINRNKGLIWINRPVLSLSCHTVVCCVAAGLSLMKVKLNTAEQLSDLLQLWLVVTLEWRDRL